MKDVRKTALNDWLNQIFSINKCELLPLSGDAGFRRYFRFYVDNQTYIAVDSPVERCNNRAFNDIQLRFAKANILVPEILHYQQEKGFYCLTDLGNTMLSDRLSVDTMSMYYQKAIALLPKLTTLPKGQLPVYDGEFIQRELHIFLEWLIESHLALLLSNHDKLMLQACFDFIEKEILTQPNVFMHRDFHSRNLMLTGDNIAVIDFQDAVYGPITYDIVSLLRDCYVKWPNDKVFPLFEQYIEVISAQLSLPNISKAQWRRWFDLTGLQRHVKASGIFARLHQRDNKSSYLKDIPLTLSYIIEVGKAYPELTFLHELVENIVLPKVLEKQGEQA